MAFVQKISGEGENVNTLALVFASNVAANNFLALQVAVYLAGNPPNTAPTGGGTWATTTEPTPQNSSNAHLFYCEAATGGATTVTYDCGDGMYVNAVATEHSGVVTTTSIDKQASNSNAGSTTPSSGVTAATAQADELVLAHVCVATAPVAGGVSLDVPAATGYTNNFVDQIATPAADTNAISSDYKVVAATGPQEASWGSLAGSYAWIAKIATFKLSTGAASFTITPAGGVAFSGAPVINHGRAFAPSGGFALGGAPVINHGRAFAPAGGFALGGDNAQLHGRLFIPVGGVAFGGSAAIIGSGVVAKMLSLMGVGK